jgi:hypothetical protein
LGRLFEFVAQGCSELSKRELAEHGLPVGELASYYKSDSTVPPEWSRPSIAATRATSSKVASTKPRLHPDQLPLEPREAIMQVPEWDNLDSGWGVGN